MSNTIRLTRGPRGVAAAIVGYRDHCDGDKLLEVYPLEGVLAKVTACGVGWR